MNPEQIRQEIAAAQAQLDQARAELANARDALTQASATLSAAQAAYDNATASVEAKQATVNTLQARLEQLAQTLTAAQSPATLLHTRTSAQGTTLIPDPSTKGARWSWARPGVRQVTPIPPGEYDVDCGGGLVVRVTLKPGQTLSLDTTVSPPKVAPLSPATVPPADSSTLKLPQLAPSVNLPGPLRGLHAADHVLDGQRDQWQVPGYDYSDEYDRPQVAELCPAQGVYNVQAIIDRINASSSRNRCYAFGISATDSDDFNSWPAWMRNRIPSSLSSYGSVWNAPVWMDTYQGLINALGSISPDLKKWIRWIDVRIGGWFGEGHYGGPNAQGSYLTPGNMRTLIDLWLSAFPTTQLISMTDPDPTTNTRYALEYAISSTAGTPRRMGWRRDNFSNPSGPPGNPDYGFNWISDPAYSNAALARWQYAPVIVENWGPYNNYSGQDWSAALQQARRFHISAFKDQNHGRIWAKTDGKPGWDSLAQRNLWQQCWTEGGYRLSVLEVTRPASAPVGSPVAVTLKWQNSGNAPLYVAHRAELYLVAGNGAEVRKGALGVDLTGLAAGSTKTLSEILDTGGVAPGSYDLRLRAVEAQGLPKPLQLGISGGLPDGGYSLGTFSIG